MTFYSNLTIIYATIMAIMKTSYTNQIIQPVINVLVNKGIYKQRLIAIYEILMVSILLIHTMNFPDLQRYQRAL